MKVRWSCSILIRRQSLAGSASIKKMIKYYRLHNSRSPNKLAHRQREKEKQNYRLLKENPRRFAGSTVDPEVGEEF